MIQIKLVGGAKKLFLCESLVLDESDISIDELLSLLLKKKPSSTPSFDTTNLLIAVNGADSSALNGKSTILKNNDVVSIIPIIHGGVQHQLRLTILNKPIQITHIHGKKSHGISLLETLRKNFPKIRLQAVSSKFILDRYHLERIILLSLKSEKHNVLLSNKLETDLLMRFALSGQISTAINTVGIKPNQDFILIAIGSTKELNRFCNNIPDSAPIFNKDNTIFLKRHFHLTKKQLDSAHSENPVADILVEKAATLFC